MSRLLALPLAFALLLAHLLPGAAQAALPPLPRYTLEAQLEYAAAHLDVSQRVELPNQTGVTLDRVVFQVTPAYFQAIELASVAVDGQPADWSLDGTVLEVLLPAPLQPNATATILLDYHLAVPRAESRFGAGPRALALGNWFPVLAPYRGDWVRHQYRDVGDAFFTEVADFEVALQVDADVSIAHSGVEVSHEGRSWTFRAEAVRDFALVVSPLFDRYRLQTGATTIEVYSVQPGLGERYAAAARRYLEWYGDTLGAYPYPELDLALIDLPPSYGGMEYPGLVLLDAEPALPEPPDGSYAEYLVAHELAHQWFYSWVGNDQVQDPWLDEAFATYLPLLYDRVQRPGLFPSTWAARIESGYQARVAAAGGLPASSGINAFVSDTPYYAIVYRKGARYLGELNDILGDEAFLALLRDYVGLFHAKVATPRAFLDLAQSRAESNLNPLGARYFEYGVLTYPEPPRWTLSLPPGPLGGSADIAVHAEFPLERVELILDGRVLYDGPPSATLALDLAGTPAGEYLLLVRLTDVQGALLERALRIEVA